MDIWQNTAGVETAKRAIEVALVGGLPISFAPYEGAAYQFVLFDVAKFPADQREKAQAHFDRYGGEPMGLAAAADRVNDVRVMADYLAERCGLPPLDTARADSAMRIDVSPITLADFALPPPTEPVEIVVARVMTAIEKLPSIPTGLSHVAQMLLDKWTQLVPNAPVRDVIEIARCIEALGGYNQRNIGAIERMSLAEAISYCHQ